MMNALDVIDKYYPRNDELRQLLLTHSWKVATLALRCAAAHPELPVDRALVVRGSLLHDLGIFATNAPSSPCHGTEHYLKHGFIGGQLLRALGMEAEARICERHTGAGLTPDFLPESIEEKLVCYADKFYSKSRPDATLTFEQIHAVLLRFGADGAARFTQWHEMFSI